MEFSSGRLSNGSREYRLDRSSREKLAFWMVGLVPTTFFFVLAVVVPINPAPTRLNPSPGVIDWRMAAFSWTAAALMIIVGTYAVRVLHRAVTLSGSSIRWSYLVRRHVVEKTVSEVTEIVEYRRGGTTRGYCVKFAGGTRLDLSMLSGGGPVHFVEALEKTLEAQGLDWKQTTWPPGFLPERREEQPPLD